MQFDDSRVSEDPWETEHKIIKEKFNKTGYELPEIVYWYVHV